MGPGHARLDDQRWTLARIAAVIKERFGVEYTLRGTSLSAAPDRPVAAGPRHRAPSIKRHLKRTQYRPGLLAATGLHLNRRNVRLSTSVAAGERPRSRLGQRHRRAPTPFS
ncbi:winged helix-turn-helix domain-containing protein [Actinomadura alba]|uniref:Winged helix-turn-helix domain-containing protein n=1 Tax=Actinomadura alba TaxID=406431 RepID=A0ABR7LNT5_9ACTN|nr:winged helix-turn-helix domain-containing protein [Actinomadura alba]